MYAYSYLNGDKMTNKNQEVVIKIDDSNGYFEINPDELIHQDAYDSLRKSIKSTLLTIKDRALNSDKKTSPSNNSSSAPGSGLVYFIDGSRGAGKTTFLRTLYESLSDQLAKPDESNNIVRVEKLDYIDPTRLEKCENLLLYVLRGLKVIIENSHTSVDNEISKGEFRQYFKKLAGGLSLFRDDHNQLNHLDPELFFDRGLTRAEDSRSLRAYFHKAVESACKILNIDALMLAFDDADTNAQHAFPLLECIRNYLDSPQLLVLVTGDMELYSLLVRDEFSKRLPIIKDERNQGREIQRARMLDHLEDQYVLKLFPLSRRQHLKTLYKILDKDYDKNDTANYKMSSPYWQDLRDPFKVLDEIITRGMRIASQSDIYLFRTHLLKQPLRSILQVLQNCIPHLSKSDSHIKNEWSRSLSDALRSSLRAMAQGSLYKQGIMVDELTANYLPTLSKAVFDICCQDGDIDTAAYLRPQASNDDLNNCYLSLAAEVAGQCAESASASLKYMLSGPGNVTLWGKEKRRMSGSIDLELLYKQFSQYMAVGRNEDALDWARRATAVLAARHPHQPKFSVVDFGIIGLNKREPDEARGARDNFNTIFNILNSLDGPYPTIAYSLLDISSQSSRCYSSIYNILGLVERLFEAQSEQEILRRLKSTYPQLSISSPDWGGSFDSLPLEETSHTSSEDAIEAIMSSESESSLIKAISAWKKMNENSFNFFSPSSVLLGKIWIRIYFSLEKASDTNRSGSASSGKNIEDIMEINAACIINAFLIEEADHNLLDYTSSLDRTNPQTSAIDIFKKKKDFFEKNKETLPLTTLISSCPIILGLLKKESRGIIKAALSLHDDITNIPDAQLPSKAFITGRWRKTESVKTTSRTTKPIEKTRVKDSVGDSGDEG